ncbi:hypothetical protein EBB07_22445 [Paenibacillaceae bacterium]|nr:hypothetical protein EBB07_22445 [Paenibacillaceae bacterium]
MSMATNTNVATARSEALARARNPLTIRMRLAVRNKRRRTNKFFIGYRKHSIVCLSPQGSIVLLSIVLPNETADVRVMLSFVEMMKKIEGIQVNYLVADLGYFNAEGQKTALIKHDVAVVTEIKKNTRDPDHCSPEGGCRFAQSSGWRSGSSFEMPSD